MIPDDDPTRALTVITTDSTDVPHLALAGDTYSILVSGRQTAGAYCLIDMRIPDGGGPPLHRHDFEEMFTVLEGEIEFTFRGRVTTATAGTTVNIPANAPHHFGNRSGAPARMLCLCTPAGQDEFFLLVGDRVPDATSPPPVLTDDERAARGLHALQLADDYRTEML